MLYRHAAQFVNCHAFRRIAYASLVSVAMLASPMAALGVDCVNGPNSSDCTVPVGAAIVNIQAWGAGGGGGSGFPYPQGKAGGGGGSYCGAVFSVTPGTLLTVHVGMGGGPSVDGESSYVTSAGITGMEANGGSAANAAAGGSGGTVAACTAAGATKFAGGNGADGFTIDGGGGGGGSATASAAGGNAPAGTGAGGTGEGNGGDSHSDGEAPGGGGGGSDSDTISGSGAGGAIIMTFSGVCGNGVVEPGETCDPPGSPAGSGTKCRADCTYCGDGIKNGGKHCSAPLFVDVACTTNGDCIGIGTCVSETCDPLNNPKCLPDCSGRIHHDPAVIRYGVGKNGSDLLYVHGSITNDRIIPVEAQPAGVRLTNRITGAVVFEASVPVGAGMSIRTTKLRTFYRYQNIAAKTAGGVSMFKVAKAARWYRVTVWVWDDSGRLATATPEMTVELFFGSQEWKSVGRWRKTRKGWYMFIR